MDQALSRTRITGQRRPIGKPSRHCTDRYLTDSCKTIRIRHRSLKWNGQKVHASKRTLLRKNTTRTMLREKSADGVKDFVASPRTQLVNIRQQLANVKTTRKQSQDFVKREVQPLPAVKSSLLTCSANSVSYRDLNRIRSSSSSSANNLKMHILEA